MKSCTITRSAMLLLGCLGLTGISAGCSGGGAASTTESSPGQSLDALLLGGHAGFGADAGEPPCLTCVEGSCGAQVAAVKTELTSLRVEAADAFACVRDNECFSLFFTDRDAGRASADTAVKACLVSCETEAGLPSRESAMKTLETLASALDMCIDSSCHSQCPEPAHDRDDQ